MAQHLNKEGIPYGFSPLIEGREVGPNEAVATDERTGIQYVGPKSYFDGPTLADIDLIGRANRSYEQTIKQAFQSPGAFTQAVGAVFKKRFAEPLTSVVAQGVEQLNPLAPNPFMPRQPGPVAQGVAEVLVPPDITTAAIHAATGPVGRMFGAPALGRELAGQRGPRLLQGAKRIGAMSGVGAGGAALEGRDPLGGAAQGAFGQGLAETAAFAQRYVRRFLFKEGPQYAKDAANFAKAAEGSVVAFQGKMGGGKPEALAEFGKTRGTSLLNKWYGDEVQNIGQQITAGVRALPASRRQNLGTFDPRGTIPDWDEYLSLKQAHLGQQLQAGQRLSWNELMDAYRDISKRAFSEAESQALVKGKLTDLKVVWEQTTAYIESTLGALQTRLPLPAGANLVGQFTDMKDQYARGSAVVDLLRTGIKGSGAGSKFVTSKVQRSFSEDLKKAAALEKRLGTATPQFEKSITRGAGFGAIDTPSEGPTPFLTTGGATGRLREYIKAPQLVGYPTRPYELTPEQRRMLEYILQGTLGREVQ